MLAIAGWLRCAALILLALETKNKSTKNLTWLSYRQLLATLNKTIWEVFSSCLHISFGIIVQEDDPENSSHALVISAYVYLCSQNWMQTEAHSNNKYSIMHVFYSLLYLSACVFKVTLHRNASPSFFFLGMIQLNLSPCGGLFLHTIPTGLSSLESCHNLCKY